MPLRRGGSDRKVQLISKVDLFSECNQKELSRIASLADEIEVDKGTVLTKEGMPGRECFIVSEGKAKCTLRGKRLATYGAGDVFGEMSLLDNEPRSATITAESDMVLFVVDSRSFWGLCEEAPSVTRKIMKSIAQRLRRVEKAPT
jgi:CRP/FNR family transcriptional regulator/CRP/FNR family cyclic AMP-dependent transcriptional regulator